MEEFVNFVDIVPEADGLSYSEKKMLMRAYLLEDKETTRTLIHPSLDPKAPISCCWIVQPGPGIYPLPYGHSRVNVNGKKIFAHRVMYMAYYREFDLGDSEVSHLCGTPGCVNPLHLILESHEMNMSRRDCPGTMAHDGLFHIMCPHEPRLTIKMLNSDI
ncbi:hypothetical protein ADUPG1_008070 [Aduncisulcus paluster]|uniref:Zinc-binding loop region of homing endonuclease domain-containing protein n=1 Tax=Aduncisulcus paluster TaxID=2918883 RepID=A0ABQ5KTM8_9EUKA|nr:hypothetical protein ADUPG1_008070 [Aduncisulcus paluster]